MSEGRHSAIPRIATRGGLFHTNNFRDALWGGHQQCDKEKEQLQERLVAVSPSLVLTLVTSWGREVGSRVSESAQEVSFSPCKLFCAALPVVEESLFKLTAFPDSLNT